MEVQRITIISRQSTLALKQVDEVISYISAHRSPLQFTIQKVSSYGDNHREIVLATTTEKDIFTRELDQAILGGNADIGIHSAKDLPFPLPDGIDIIALSPPNDRSDSLVGNFTITEMPKSAKIGTSSAERIKQLKAIRADLEPYHIRGSIEERLALVDKGELDGVIIATCALNRLGLAHRIKEVLPFETHPLQGYLAITARSDRPDLKKIFFDYDIRNSYLKGQGDIYGLEQLYQKDKDIREALISSKLLYTGLNPGHLAQMPYEIDHYPCIRIEEVPSIPKIALEDYDSIIFTSKSSVTHFLRHYKPTKQRIIAIGDYTKGELSKHGYENVQLPGVPDSDSLKDFIINHDVGACLYPCSDRSANDIHELKNVSKSIFYQTLINLQPQKDLSLYRAVYFTSPSTVDSFSKIYGHFPKKLLYFTIGKITFKTLLKADVPESQIINLQEAVQTDHHEVVEISK